MAGTTSYYSLRIKHVFLSFAQSLFAAHPELTWSLDPSTSKIIISDSYSVEQETVENLPAIVLTRGSFAFTKATIDQRYSKDLVTRNTEYADLMQGSVTYNIFAKNGLFAERIADYLHSHLITFKSQFRKNGISNIKRIVLGNENLVKTRNEIELVSIPISITYETPLGLGYYVDPYDLKLTSTVLTGTPDGSGLSDQNKIGVFLANVDFTVSGQYIVFTDAPVSGSSLNAEYVGSSTLSEYTETLTGIVNGVNKIFSLTEEPYAYNYIFNNLIINESEIN